MATKRTEQWNDEDLDVIMSLLEKDYTKDETEKAPHFPPLYGSGPLFQEAEQEEPKRPLREETVSTEEISWDKVVPVMRKQEEPEETAPKKKGKGGLVAILVLEIIVLLGLIGWWIQWLL